MNRHATQLRILAIVAMTIGLVAGATIATRSQSGTIRVAGHLGPTPGPNSQGHVEAKRAYLDRLALLSPERPAAGLASLAKLEPPAQVAAFTKGMEVSAVFVAFPAGEPEALPVAKTIQATVAARAAELAVVMQGEVTSLETQVKAAKGPAKQSLQVSLGKRKAALASVKSGCACVYAIAVERSTLGALQQLSKRPDVLLVDVPNPITDALAGWELTPILPKPKA